VRTSRLLLQDIIDAIGVIEHYTPSSLAEFIANPPVQSHIIRHIAIIGEAASRLPKAMRDANSSVPWRQIIDMRNIVVHVYHGINWTRVYDTARDDVPVLRTPIDAIIAALPPDPLIP
jgi:uncharacterized protein with HEPN domain